MQDSKGYIWIAHDEGLSRYDGQEIKTYSGNKQGYKAGSHINEDKYGRIWYQTFDGYMYYIQGDSIHNLPNQIRPVGYMPYGLLDTALVIIGEKGIDLYSINTLKRFANIGIPVNVFSNAVATNSIYYFTANNTLISVNPKGDTLQSTIEKGMVGLVAQNRIFSIERAKFDGWIYEVKNGKCVPTFHVPGVKFIQGLIFAGGYYWVCTTEGIWGFYPDGRSINNNRPLFAGKNISGVAKDSEGNFWFSTLNEGVLFVPDFNARITKIDNAIPSKIAIRKNDVYIATNKNEIYQYIPATSKLSLLYKDEVPHHVNNFTIDTFNNLFLVSAQMLKVFNNNFTKVLTNHKPVKEATVIDGKYYAYSATSAAGMMKVNEGLKSDWDGLYNSGTLSEQNKESILLSGNRYRVVLHNQANGNLYFSGSTGLFKCNKNKTGIKELVYSGNKVFTSQLILYKKYVVALTTNNQLLTIDEEDSIAEIKSGNDIQLYKCYIINNELHVLTDKGIKHYNEATNKLEFSNILSGIKCEDIHDIQQQNNQILIATNKGIITMPAMHNVPSPKPLFHITQIVVNNSRIINDSTAELSYKENNVEIQYTTPAFRNPAQYPVLYKINDGNWVQTSTATRSLKLASLSPGSYTISFAQDMGNNNLHIAGTIMLNIDKPYWMTMWFWLVVISISGALIYIYYKWQTGILKKQNILLTEKVALERNLHQSVLTSIRSQMNPHFFYNALNTIQSYIVTDDKRNAAAYLSKFSKLTRTILEMTGKETVTLTEEINALKLYLDLEKVRFNNELHYAVNVINGLEVDVVRIPSMIVQPYIENSLKHGLLHKSGEKILLVDFLKRDGNLSIIIDDNGIGRKKSQELNKIRADKHKPFATEANMKRIEILNKGNNNIGVVYTDKTDAFGQSNGTIVTITIPLIKENK